MRDEAVKKVVGVLPDRLGNDERSLWIEGGERVGFEISQYESVRSQQPRLHVGRWNLCLLRPGDGITFHDAVAGRFHFYRLSLPNFCAISM
jgi:hypothetical protein